MVAKELKGISSFTYNEEYSCAGVDKAVWDAYIKVSMGNTRCPAWIIAFCHLH
jgi:hypothetical protein